MSTVVDLDTAGYSAWSTAATTRVSERGSLRDIRPGATGSRWSIDPSAAFAKAIAANLPHAAISVDAFHLVKLANRMVTAVRQRLSQQQKNRRVRLVDPLRANRRLLLRGADTLSPRGWARLRATFTSDDPTDELAAAWGIKEQLRRLLACSSMTDAHQEKMRLGHYVQVADMPETDRLWATICQWWPAIEVLIVTGVTNAKTEAANTGIKNIERIGRRFRNAKHYRARILLTSAAHSAA